MQRKFLGVHLEVCPASVIMCMAEWNRWPVYSSVRRKNVPFRQSNPHAEPGQLDFDLAKRDQRMLQSLDVVPREMKIVLRNNLTRRFPAVPIPSPNHKLVFSHETKNIDPNNNNTITYALQTRFAMMKFLLISY